MIDLSKIIEAKLNKLDSQISDVKFERDNSATPMESHSDKSRQLAEQLMDALTEERKNLMVLKREVNPHDPLLIYTLMTPLGEKDFALVPDGLGGSTVNGTSLLSRKTPLATKLSTIKEGETFSFNGQNLTLVKKKTS